MRRKYVVSSQKQVKDFDKFITSLKIEALRNGVIILGYTVVEGPGCTNHGLFLSGYEEACVHLVEALAHAFVGKCGEVSITDPAVEDGIFKDYTK